MLNKVKSILTGKKSSKSKTVDEESVIHEFKKDFNKVFGLIGGYFSDLASEIGAMKEKSKNLLKTNVNLGLKHLNNDKISDAILRFKIISIIWPNHVKTYYYLAHCYILKNSNLVQVDFSSVWLAVGIT